MTTSSTSQRFHTPFARSAEYKSLSLTRCAFIAFCSIAPRNARGRGLGLSRWPMDFGKCVQRYEVENCHPMSTMSAIIPRTRAVPFWKYTPRCKQLSFQFTRFKGGHWRRFGARTITPASVEPMATDTRPSKSVIGAMLLLLAMRRYAKRSARMIVPTISG